MFVLVSIGGRKELHEVELVGSKDSLKMTAIHHFGISVVSLNQEEAMQLRAEIDEWLEEKKDLERPLRDLA